VLDRFGEERRESTFRLKRSRHRREQDSRLWRIVNRVRIEERTPTLGVAALLEGGITVGGSVIVPCNGSSNRVQIEKMIDHLQLFW
jgi:hypothetical protein